MAYQDMKRRTFLFSASVFKFCEHIPNKNHFRNYSDQLTRCSSSAGANYRASQRTKSKADFINKLKIVEEECDESMFFLELINEVAP